VSDYVLFLYTLFKWITRVISDKDVRNAILRASRGKPDGEIRDWAETDDIEPLDEDDFAFSDKKMDLEDIAAAMGIDSVAAMADDEDFKENFGAEAEAKRKQSAMKSKKGYRKKAAGGGFAGEDLFGEGADAQGADAQGADALGADALGALPDDAELKLPGVGGRRITVMQLKNVAARPPYYSPPPLDPHVVCERCLDLTLFVYFRLRLAWMKMAGLAASSRTPTATRPSSPTRTTRC